MKIFSCILLFILYSSSLHSQTTKDWNSISSGKWAFEVNPSLFVLNYKLDFFLSSDDKKHSINEFLKNKNLDIDEGNSEKFKHGDNFYLVTNFNKKNRIFRVLKERDNYYILCSDDEKICDCKQNSFIYFKHKNILQRVEKPFSFSLKNNLLDRMQKQNIQIPKNTETMSYCEVLESL